MSPTVWVFTVRCRATQHCHLWTTAAGRALFIPHHVAACVRPDAAGTRLSSGGNPSPQTPRPVASPAQWSPGSSLGSWCKWFYLQMSPHAIFRALRAAAAVRAAPRTRGRRCPPPDARRPRPDERRVCRSTGSRPKRSEVSGLVLCLGGVRGLVC